MRLLELGHLEKDYPITTFFENKRFSRFFANKPIKVMNFEGHFLRGQVSSNAFKVFNHCIKLNLEFYWSVCKKTSESFVFKKRFSLYNLLPSALV